MSAIHDQTDCSRTLDHLDAYVDGELADPRLIACIEQHMSRCASCAEEAEAIRDLDRRLKELPEQHCSFGLEESVAALAGRAKLRRRSIRSALGTRSASSRMAAVALGVAGLALIWFFVIRSDVQNVQEAGNPLSAYVEDHVAYVQSDDAPRRQSTDPADLEAWFSGRLAFAPKLPRWDWARPISGQLCFVHGQRVARVNYESEDGMLTLFVQPAAANASRTTGKADGPLMSSVPHIQPLRGYHVACWLEKGLEYILVAPASAEELLKRLGGFDA
jgi:anti-sigma factor RsiW